MFISLGNLGKPFGKHVFTNKNDKKQSLYQKSYSRVRCKKNVNTKSVIIGNSPVKKA